MTGAIELKTSLTSLHGPKTSPITAQSDEPAVQELVDLFNSMLAKAQAALEDYTGMREQLRRALGDQSCLADLQQRLTSLSDNCLAGLAEGLAAAAEGDLTVDAHPVTTPLEAPGAYHARPVRALRVMNMGVEPLPQALPIDVASSSHSGFPNPWPA